MPNVVASTHDYQTGARLVSVTRRERHKGLGPMLTRLMDKLILGAEEKYPRLKGLVGWTSILSSVLDVLGETAGLEALRKVQDQPVRPDLDEAVPAFLAEMEEDGFTPLKVHFAIERYRRWAELSQDPTPEARARTLRELFETYGLSTVTREHPETRVRFFRKTVFEGGGEELAPGLRKLETDLHNGVITQDEIADGIADLRGRTELTEDEDYFLARLSFPHLRPEDAASFVDADFGGRQLSEVVVKQEDREGNPFRIRHALNPREVGRLHRLFLAAKLDVRFRMEHQYLVALNQRTQVIGGIFYEVAEGENTAHLEKIVVAEPYRRAGVADALMHELFNRLQAAGYRAVTTGFFRPEYFYAYGFTIEKRYAGLVKSLESAEEETN
jgi:ribosomal protein S18 acetylase RimI-like enzyme